MLLEETNPFFQGQGEQRAVICKCTRCRSYLCCGKLAKESGGKTNFLKYFFGIGGSSGSIHKERRQALLLEWVQGSWIVLFTPDIKVLSCEELSALLKSL